MNNITDEQLASLIEENMGLVVLAVNSFGPKDSLEKDELMQLGRIGLWKAIKKHNPKRSKLSTCMYNYVRWEIGRYLYKKSKTKYADLHENIMCNKSVDNVWEYIPEFLSNKEKDVVSMRLEGHSFVDIGKKLGYSRGWANNVFQKALDKINNANSDE